MTLPGQRVRWVGSGPNRHYDPGFGTVVKVGRRVAVRWDLASYNGLRGRVKSYGQASLQEVSPKMTPARIDLMRHALGLGEGQHTSYRNRFVVGEDGDDYFEWGDMVAEGLAMVRGPIETMGGMSCFWLTVEAAHCVLYRYEKLGKDFRC